MRPHAASFLAKILMIPGVQPSTIYGFRPEQSIAAECIRKRYATREDLALRMPGS
jgi:hypothetical protein